MEENQRKQPIPTMGEKILALGLEELNIQFLQQQRIGPYIVDFIIPDAMLIIEVEGKIHLEIEGFEYDRKRRNYLTRQGYRIYQLTDEQVRASPEKKSREIQHAIEDLRKHITYSANQNDWMRSFSEEELAQIKRWQNREQ